MLVFCSIPKTVPDKQSNVAIAGHPVDWVLSGDDQANRADGWRGQYGGAVCFVIQRDITRDDGHIQCCDGFRNALDCPNKLAHDFWLFRIAKIHIIRGGQWFCPHGDQIAIGFCYRLLAPFKGIGLNVTRGDITGESQ